MTKTRSSDFNNLKRISSALLHSAYLTLFLYYLLSIILFFSIKNGYLVDPAAKYEANEGCSREESLATIKLAKSLHKFFGQTQNQRSFAHFLCYRSVYNSIRIKEALNKNSKYLDLCVIRKYQSLATSNYAFMKKLQYHLQVSELENATVSFDALRGVFKINFMDSNAFIHMYSVNNPNIFDFKVERDNILHYQFRLTKVMDEKHLYIPNFMVRNMSGYVNYMYQKFPVANGMLENLMYFTPKNWWQHDEKCTNGL